MALGGAGLSLSLYAVQPARAEGVPEAVDKVGQAIRRGLRGTRKVYAYTDDRGRLTYIERLDQVPVRLQPYAREVDAPPGYFDDEDEDDSLFDEDLFSFGGDNEEKEKRRAALGTIYKVELPDGRVVYTNLAERVPPEKRAQATVDLAHISLHTELGNEIDKRLKLEHEKLLGSKYCRDLRDDANAPLSERLWRDEQPLVICVGAVLVLLLLTPWMVRHVGGPQWGRTLMMAVPALVIAGLVMFAMMKANGALVDLRGKAKPCEQASWDTLAAKPETALRDRLSLVQQLQQQLAAIENLGKEGR